MIRNSKKLMHSRQNYILELPGRSVIAVEISSLVEAIAPSKTELALFGSMVLWDCLRLLDGSLLEPSDASISIGLLSRINASKN